MDQLTRIEIKLDQIDKKLDDHIERIAKTEISISWLKWGLSILLSVSSVIGLSLSKYIGR